MSLPGEHIYFQSFSAFDGIAEVRTDSRRILKQLNDVCINRRTDRYNITSFNYLNIGTMYSVPLTIVN